MSKRTTFAVLAGLLAAALLPAACRDSISPDRGAPPAAQFAPAADPIALDQQNGTLNETNTAVLRKGFNPTNPHVGDAIIATFFWLGSTNIVDSVIDLLADGTPVGNHYTLIQYVTADNISMATFVATNVQNFPEGTFQTGEKILVVQANLSSPVADGGVLISAYTGVHPTLAQALGARASASGTGSGQTIAHPGTIAVNAGALAYGVTMSNRVVGLTTPPDFTTLAVGPMTNDSMKVDGEF